MTAARFDIVISMNLIIRRTLSVVAVVIILLISFFAWFYIEIGFDGCCGAPLNSDNDGLQSLAHLGAYVLGIALIWLALWWGWRSPKKP
jgi:heme A synthase